MVKPQRLILEEEKEKYDIILSDDFDMNDFIIVVKEKTDNNRFILVQNSNDNRNSAVGGFFDGDNDEFQSINFTWSKFTKQLDKWLKNKEEIYVWHYSNYADAFEFFNR